jgi:hypothetical protein
MNLTSGQIVRFSAQFTDPNMTLEELGQVWGKTRGTLYRWGLELGVSRPKRASQLQLALDQAIPIESLALIGYDDHRMPCLEGGRTTSPL